MNKRLVLGIFVCVLGAYGCSQNEVVTVKPHKGKRAGVLGEAATAAVAPAPQPSQQKTPRRENPFLSLEEEESFTHKQLRVALAGYNLSAIFYAPPHSKAIINGSIVKTGDILAHKEIVMIEAQEVILKDSEGEYYLRLKELSQ